jgi:hypothetical protein
VLVNPVTRPARNLGPFAFGQTPQSTGKRPSLKCRSNRRLVRFLRRA